MKIVAAGMSGLIGRSLSAEIAKKHELVRLVRKASSVSQQLPGREVLWDPRRMGDWTKEIDGADAVVNLCGEGIADKRWTPARKKVIKDSRLIPVTALVEAMDLASKKPKSFLSASAIGYYGPHDAYLIDEDSGPGIGFLSELCVEWENEARCAERHKIRVVLLRTGIVLSREGGALSKMVPPFNFFAGGPLGNGKQFMSWIHIKDEIRAVMTILENPAIQGPVNLTTASCVTMNDFASALGKELKKPSFFRVPAPALRLLLGEMSEMLLTGQKVYPQKLSRAGFRFRFESLEEALRDIFRL